MPEDHSPYGPLFSAIGRHITEKLISTNLNGSVGIQRHLVGLPEVPARIAEIGIWFATRRRRRRRDGFLIASVADEDFVGIAAGCGGDIAERLLARCRVLYVCTCNPSAAL
jgi:hypothetical protein